MELEDVTRPLRPGAPASCVGAAVGICDSGLKAAPQDEQNRLSAETRAEQDEQVNLRNGVDMARKNIGSGGFTPTIVERQLKTSRNSVDVTETSSSFRSGAFDANRQSIRCAGAGMSKRTIVAEDFRQNRLECFKRSTVIWGEQTIVADEK